MPIILGKAIPGAASLAIDRDIGFCAGLSFQLLCAKHNLGIRDKIK
jgi:hypothetical protein